MEQTINNPTQIYSVSGGNQMHAERACLNKKRKFLAEQLDLPLRKHRSLPSNYLESNSMKNGDNKGINPSLIKVESSRWSCNDISQSETATYSNSLSGGDYTTMSISGQIRKDIWFSKTRLHDQPSTSSVNCTSTYSTQSLYSLESRSMAESSSSSDEIESTYKVDFRNDNMEQCTEDEDQDVIYSNVVIANNYVLSSGRWPVNQDSEQGAKKLTIDIEFEQYFSSLMI